MARLSEYKLSDIFSFEERDIVSHMLYELKLGWKFRDAFNYLITKLPIQKLRKDLGKLKWDEGKSYDWAIIKEGVITLIIRRYRTHFTIFFKSDAKDAYFQKYGCFSYHSDTRKLSDKDSDRYCDNNFIDLNESIKPIIKMLSEGNVHSLWNNYSFIRPEHVEVKNIWNGGDTDISSINDFIFCCDELFSKYLERFAQTDMMDKLKTIKVGDVLNNKYEVLRVAATTKNNYFHDAGLELKGTNGKDSKDWKDVYCLTRYYLNDIFL